MLTVCPLSQLEKTVSRVGARHLISLMSAGAAVDLPTQISPQNYLSLSFNDIAAPRAGLIAPQAEHMRALLAYVRRWGGSAPLVIHCWAGISRSTAAAYIAACALSERGREAELAHLLRASSPSATPNGRMIALADELLERDGEMIDAIKTIGRGADAFEGAPFTLAYGEPSCSLQKS